VAVFLMEICAPGITPPDGSEIVPERVAPVTCEYIETATDRLKTMTINGAKTLVSFRVSIACTEHLLNDHAVIVIATFDCINLQREWPKQRPIVSSAVFRV
jgi:hypothetical protein